jgi:C-terminal processing protease CtpA/Prc
MKWMRSLIPGSLLGMAAMAIVGVTFAAQNQDDEKNAQQKPAAATTQKNAAAPAATAPATTDPAASRAAQGKPQVAGLGAQFEVQGNQGLRVATLEENGALARSGLKQNDRIISIDGLTFSSSRQVEAYLWSHVGRPLPIVVDRDGKQSTLQATIPVPTTRGGWLGIYLDQGDTNVKGARVAQVYPAGPAARANLQPGDVITQIDTHPVAGAADAVMLIRELQPNTEVVFTLQRGTEEEKVNVTVGMRGNTNYQSGFAGQNPNFAGGQQFGQPYNENHQFNGIPPHAMQLENDRRMAEQHERIEDEIRQLRDEIRQLREALQKK